MKMELMICHFNLQPDYNLLGQKAAIHSVCALVVDVVSVASGFEPTYIITIYRRLKIISKIITYNVYNVYIVPVSELLKKRMCWKR